jgi:hypothetical protein
MLALESAIGILGSPRFLNIPSVTRVIVLNPQSPAIVSGGVVIAFTLNFDSVCHYYILGECGCGSP